MSTEVSTSQLIVNMHRLEKNLFAFRDINEHPKFFGGRFIDPLKSPNISDYVNEALTQTLGRLFNAASQYFLGTQDKESPEIQAKRALVKDLEHLASRVQTAYEAVMGCLKNDFDGIETCRENAGLLFHFGSVMVNLPAITKGVTHYLGEFGDLSFLSSQAFLDQHKRLTTNTSPKEGLHLKPLLAWWTLPEPPPLNLLIKVAKNPSAPIDVSDCDVIRRWAQSCSTSNMPPSASDYYDLIKHMCSCEGALPNPSFNQQLIIEERCIQTLERLWSDAGLDLFAPCIRSIDKLEYAKQGAIVYIENPESDASGMPQERVFAKVLKIEGPKGYLGVLKTLTVQIMQTDESSDTPSQTYQACVFNDPMLGLIHHRRIRKELQGCPLFQTEQYFDNKSPNDRPRPIFSLCSCEVSIREYLAPFDGDFNAHADSLSKAFEWMATNKVCFDLDPNNLGVCPKTNALKFKPPFTQGVKESQKGQTLELDVAIIENRVLQGQDLRNLPEGMRNALENLYSKAYIPSRSDALKKTHENRVSIDESKLDPVTRRVLQAIKDFDPTPESPTDLLHQAVDALSNQNAGSQIFRILSKVQSSKFQPQVNSALTEMLTQKAQELNNKAYSSPSL